jgi:hypothetical protein
VPFGARSSAWESAAMEDLVAVAVRLDDGREALFLTWGRLYNAVDPRPVAAIVLSASGGFAIGGTPVGARLCSSLSSAANADYFYEGLFDFAQRPIPFGVGYSDWRREKLARVAKGQDLYFVGVVDGPPDLPDLDVQIGDGYELPAFEHLPPAPLESDVSALPPLWAFDELICHIWRWDGQDWVLTENSLAEMDGCPQGHDMGVVGDRHLICEQCGWTIEVEPDTGEADPG